MFKLKGVQAHDDKEKLLSIAKQLDVHCNKVRALVNGLEAAQINNKEFSLSQTFYTTTSQSLTTAINDLLGTYETLRRKVREVAQIGYINFENNYSVAASLLNLTFQMQLLRLYCYRIMKP